MLCAYIGCIRHIISLVLHENTISRRKMFEPVLIVRKSKTKRRKGNVSNQNFFSYALIFCSFSQIQIKYKSLVTRNGQETCETPAFINFNKSIQKLKRERGEDKGYEKNNNIDSKHL